MSRIARVLTLAALTVLGACQDQITNPGAITGGAAHRDAGPQTFVIGSAIGVNYGSLDPVHTGYFDGMARPMGNDGGTAPNRFEGTSRIAWMEDGNAVGAVDSIAAEFDLPAGITNVQASIQIRAPLWEIPNAAAPAVLGVSANGTLTTLDRTSDDGQTVNATALQGGRNRLAFSATQADAQGAIHVAPIRHLEYRMTITYSLPVLRPVTMLLLANPPASARFGTSVKFTATMSDPSGQDPTLNMISNGATVSFWLGGSCTEPGSSLGSGPVQAGRVSITTSTLPVGHHTVAACYSGNTRFGPGESSVEYDVTPLDDSPPSVEAILAGTLGANGWYTSDVSVTWATADAESQASVESGCVATTINADTPGATLECTALSEGGTTSSSASIKRDASAATITFTGGRSYTVDQAVAITCNASDATSLVVTQNCPGASGPAYGFAIGSNSLVASATNGAGLVATASANFTVSVTFTSLANLTAQLVPKPHAAALVTLLKLGERAIERDPRLKPATIAAYIIAVKVLSPKVIKADKATILVNVARKL